MTVRELLSFKRELDFSADGFEDITGVSAHRIRRGRVRGDVVLDGECLSEIKRCRRLFVLALELCSEREAALNWLYSPASSLGDAAPIDLAESEKGLARVEDLLRNLRQAALAAAPRGAPPVSPLPSQPDPTEKHRVAEGLRAARAAVPGLTKAELARRMQSAGFAKFQASNASRLELGYADASWPEIVALGRILNVPPDRLVTR